ncbi:hypothetical protein LR48_Vigan07g011600 [Vigna angularis]|uniref:Uncharacterized protein n=3 Tax=Phaseolus angularis TaxID=3914 RepID=A0A0L9UV06_PHAAN|nr:uncharacterized protein HKW66_Vig0253170 [Vigna angularis]KOM46412.1 hypothetical protein LR48_Vigan07g011600 [Vigna angularis]BAT80592.1 hypothetical protein VIGAN_03018300 [Vigna angularis var. angularis]
MFEAEFLGVVVTALCLLSESKFDLKTHGDALADAIPTPTTSCENCPPLSGYPSYGGASPPPTGYSTYGVPPPPPTPPPPHKTGKGQSKCPPAASVQCCTPPAPYTFGYGYGYGTPNPYYAPPNPYTYVPYGKGQGPASMILPFLTPLITLFSSFVFFI